MTAERWTIYTIMHKDRRVASIHRDGRSTVYSPAFLPWDLYLEPGKDADLETRLNNLENFYHWCASRILTLDRVYAKEILSSLGRKQAVTDRDRAEIALAYHAVSMTDVFWVRGYREAVRFSDVNLYEHSLSDAFVDVSLRGHHLTAQNAELLDPGDAAGDLGTQGVSPKAWIRRDGIFYLLKDGAGEDVEAELLASKVISCFDPEAVRYVPQVYQGQCVSACRIMTSLAHSIVSMEAVEIYAANHGKSWMDMVLQLDAGAYYRMNILDYIIGNTDRHWGNWGMLVDNQTNRPLRLHPLMDFNKAFRMYDTLEGGICQTMPRRVSQREAAEQAVRIIGFAQIRPVERDWFSDKARWEMLQARIKLLRDRSAE